MKTLLSRACCLLFLVIAVNGCKDKIPATVAVEFSETSGTDITEFSVRLASSITKSGSQEISDHGFAFSASSETPDIGSGAIKKGAIERSTPTPISFNGTLEGLEANTEYFVRPYAVTADATHFGNVLKIKTLDIRQPGIITDGSEAVTHNSAGLKGSLTSKGTHPVSEYGLVWAATANPTTAATTKYSVKSNVTAFPLAFKTTAANLSPNTTYNFRAYVISNGVTSYGANMTVQTSAINPPGITTGNADNITVSSARLGGTISRAGTLAITERGVVWGTSANPTTANAKASIAGNVANFPDNYTVNATGLSMNTAYNYRAYVISNGVTTYGENKTFRTSDQVPPGIRTDDGPKVGDKVATVWGTLTAKGSHPVSEYGICWNTAANPTTANTRKSYSGDVSAFPRQFEAVMENLNPATTYHYRAYVIMNGTTTYGENKSFATGAEPPRVTTGDVFSISGRGTVLTGTVSSQGSYPITEIGIVYGPNNNPTTANTKLSKSGSEVTYPHNYEFLVQGGFSGTGAVYFRAYVISNGNTYYGTSKVARAAAPVLATGTVTLSGSTYTLRGSVNSAGTYPIREYGIVWVISRANVTPTTADSKLAVSGAPAIPSNFTRTLSLSAIGTCRGVYYRAYAITTDGVTHYAPNTVSFSTGGCVN